MGRTVSSTYETITRERPALQFRGTNKQATATDNMTFTRASDGLRPRSTTGPTSSSDGLVSLVAPFFVKPKLDRLADETVEQLQRTLATCRSASRRTSVRSGRTLRRYGLPDIAGRGAGEPGAATSPRSSGHR